MLRAEYKKAINPGALYLVKGFRAGQMLDKGYGHNVPSRTILRLLVGRYMASGGLVAQNKTQVCYTGFVIFISLGTVVMGLLLIGDNGKQNYVLFWGYNGMFPLHVQLSA